MPSPFTLRYVMSNKSELAIAPEEVKGTPQPSRPVGVTDQISRVERMRAYFAERPKVKIRIRPSEGEQWVQINGYAFRIQAGEEVTVPVDVKNMLQDAGVI